MKSFLNLLTVLVTLLYPCAIWFGQDVLEPRLLAGLLLVLAATRLPLLAVSPVARLSLLGALGLAGVAIWSNQLLPLKLYPVLVNLVLLLVFAYSLHRPPSVVERLARLTEPDLPPAAIGYTRRVTQVWCVFFIFNGLAAAWTAIWASEAVWSIYNGVIAYLLIGTLFAAEFTVRFFFKRRHHA